MTAIADQSTVTNESLGWWIIGALATVVFGLWLFGEILEARARRRWEQERPQPAPRPCHTTGCRYPGTVLVMTVPPHHGVVVVDDVCQGCADEGTARGWWVRLPVGDPVF